MKLLLSSVQIILCKVISFKKNFWVKHLNVDFAIFFTVILSDLIKLSLSFTKTKT